MSTKQKPDGKDPENDDNKEVSRKIPLGQMLALCFGTPLASKKKKARRELWVYLRARAKVYVFCFLGVLGHRALDLAGEQINWESLSVGYAGFAIAVSVLLTLWLERREIPSDMNKKKAAEILRRMAFNALILGYGFQEAILEIGGKM